VSSRSLKFKTELEFKTKHGYFSSEDITSTCNFLTSQFSFKLPSNCRSAYYPKQEIETNRATTFGSVNPRCRNRNVESEVRNLKNISLQFTIKVLLLSSRIHSTIAIALVRSFQLPSQRPWLPRVMISTSWLPSSKHG